jgi:hypothetical protein
MNKEFILCAAINHQGIIISGHRHADCHKVLNDLLKKYNIIVSEDKLPQRKDQGFLTSFNRFVSRKEAFKIAKENNQIIHHMFDDDNEGSLTSEDLY